MIISPTMSKPTTTMRNIGVRSGMNQKEDFHPTTPVEAPDRLEQLFSRLEQNLDQKLQKLQELMAAEKEAMNRRFVASTSNIRK